MFIDASAIVAILNREPGYEDLARRIEDVTDQLYTSPMARFGYSNAASAANYLNGETLVWLNCPLRTICAVSISANVAAADSRIGDASQPVTTDPQLWSSLQLLSPQPLSFGYES